MGRKAHEKSITVIIDAIKKVVAINDNIRFLIVGGGPLLEELKEYVKNDHIEPYVIFTSETAISIFAVKDSPAFNVDACISLPLEL